MSTRSLPTLLLSALFASGSQAAMVRTVEAVRVAASVRPSGPAAAFAAAPIGPSPVGALAAAPVPVALAAAPGPVTASVARARDWLFPASVAGSYSLEAGDSFFHGTSLAHVEAVAASGGSLSARRTYVSDEPAFPSGYAASSARRTGTPSIVLQFPASAIESRLVTGHWSPVAQVGRGTAVRLAQFMMAADDIPLSELAPASKAALIAHYAAIRDFHPADGAARAKLQAIADAMGVAVPDPKPLVSIASLTPGRRIVLLDRSTARQAIYVGTWDGKATLVDPVSGKARRVRADKISVVIDLGPVSG